MSLAATPTGGRCLSDDVIEAAALRLLEAEVTKTPIRQLSLEHPEMTIDDAYAVQERLVDAKVAAGQRRIGRKIGLTSRAMQQAVSINEPDYGVLLDHMVFDQGEEVPTSRFIFPRVEVELAFILGERLVGPDVTMLDVLRATEFVTPALEILDARVQMSDPETGHLRTIVDTIADNAADAGVMVGGRTVAPTEVDLRWVAALLSRNGVIEESGVAAAVLDNPLNGVAWLANKLSVHGVALEPGELILAGSFTRPVHAYGGDVFHADYGPLGTITCRFAPEEPDA